jgi:hypothetical protein
MSARIDRSGARPRTSGAGAAAAGAAATLLLTPLAGAQEDLSQPCPRWAVELEFWSPAGCFGEAAGLGVRDVNVHGVVVGDQLCFGDTTAFMWTEDGGVEYFAFPPGSTLSWAAGITDEGIIAGTVGIRNSLRGWTYDGTTMTYIDPLPGAIQSVKVAGITPDGTVAGEIFTLNPDVPVAPFRWKDGVLTTIEDSSFGIGGISVAGVTDDGVIYGYYWDADHEPPRWQAFLLDGEVVHSLPLPPNATLSDVRGRAADGRWWGVVQIENSPGDRQFLPILWQDDGFQIPAATPFRHLIFDHAVSAGVYAGRAAYSDAYHWQRVICDRGVIRDLSDVVDHPDYFASGRVDHAEDGVLYLKSAGHPDVNIVSMIARVTPPVTADMNCDGIVQFDDLLIMLASWRSPDLTRADLDGDGHVGLGDLQALLEHWN